MDPAVQPLTDDELRAVASDDPSLINKLTSEERRRLNRLMPGPKIGAPTGREPVTFGDLQDDPSGSMQRAASLIGQSAADPREILKIIAGYALPKMFPAMPAASGEIAPPAPAAPAPSGVSLGSRIRGLATPDAAKDFAQLALGEGRVTAGLRLAQRMRSTPEEPAAPAPSGPPPRLAGKAPSLEDEITAALEEVRRATPNVKRTTLPPPQTQTATGKPSVTQAQHEALQGTKPTEEPTAEPPDKSVRGRANAPKTVPRQTTRATTPDADARLTPDEVLAKDDLVRQGYPEAEVVRALLAHRLMQSPLMKGAKDPAQVAREVNDRNATGRWK